MPYTTSSPALLARRTQQAEWGRIWHSLPITERNKFQSLAARTPISKRTGKPRMSAFLLYSALCTARANSGRQPLTIAPSAPDCPPTLPMHMTLQAAVTGGKFSLHISSLPYPNAVVVYGASPRLALTRVNKGSEYKIIGHLPSLESGTAEITALYEHAFRALQQGEKACIKIVGVSEHGYTTGPQCLESVATAAAPMQEQAQEDAAQKQDDNKTGLKPRANVTKPTSVTWKKSARQFVFTRAGGFCSTRTGLQPCAASVTRLSETSARLRYNGP